MSLLWIDGFEKYGPSGSAINPSDIIDWKYLGHYDERIDVVSGRTGNAIQLDDLSTYMCTPALDMRDSRTLICGFAFKIRDLDADLRIVDFRNANMFGETVGYGQLFLQVSGGGNGSEITLVRGNTDLTTSNTANLQTDTWYYLEMKVYCDSSSGTCNVRIDETEIISYSGNTQHRTGLVVNNRYDRVMWHPTEIDVITIDDLYIANDSGNTVNDFLGDCTVATLTPNSDVSGNWSASTGNDLYACVDETAQGSDYISEDTSGNQALFELENMSGNAVTGTVRGVMLCCESRQSQQGMSTYAKAITQNGSGGNVQTSGNFVPGTNNPLNSSVMMEKDPDGNDWTMSTVNQLRVGVEAS